MAAGSLLVLFAILATALSGPINVRQDDTTACARKCVGTSKFNYVPGTTYRYQYKVQTLTNMEGAESEKAALGVGATAEVEVLSKCEMALKLRDVTIYQSDPTSSSPMNHADRSGEFRRNLERYPLLFSFQDGVVDELCPAEGESKWALNIKRGLLSLIQNSMEHLDRDQTVKEIDIIGSCNTDYKVTSNGWGISGYSTTIKKVKDILGCTDRHGYHSSIQAMPYRVESDVQSLPLMKSTHENEQQFDRQGLLQSALIKETHTFRPFSQTTSGATTKIIQKLAYISQSSTTSVQPRDISSRTGLTFDHLHGPLGGDQSRKEAEDKLEEICRNTREDIRPETPRLFSELVYIIKKMDINTLRSVFNQVKRGSLCNGNNERTQKFFLDAIPMAGTDDAVELLVELLTNKDVEGSQADIWITSLSLIPQPTLQMLRKVHVLIDNQDFRLKSMLPVSTLINNYCRRNPSCADERTITNLLSSFEKNIDYGCYVRDSKLQEILMTLRALGNAGHSTSMVDSIRNCFTREGNPTEVRVAAVEAFRRLPCSADRNELMELYRSNEEDSELRIAAYLEVMRCPTDDVLSQVQRQLENEKANQVGSFVWSHLTNLIESSSPQKQAIRRILENASLKKEFDLETLKYSKNYEGSVFVEKVNTGAMADANLIFSESSFIPRSGMMNLTVDLFGHSINLLELGVRLEGLEYLLETYLGPHGYFSDQKTKRTAEESKSNLEKLRASLFMRIFGNEMIFKHFKGTNALANEKGQKIPNILAKMSGQSDFNILDLLIKMSKKHDYTFTQSVMILDSSMIIPTSCGFPLNMTINGTATIDLKASGQVDLRKAATKPRSLLIDGTIQPSGAVKIAGTMAVDAFVTKTGLRVVNTWHSSTAVKGRIELTRGKVLSAAIDMPEKKMEIFDVRTNFFTIHGQMENEEQLITENRRDVKLCTGQRIAKVTGLELCNEFQWANASQKSDAPYFPFTGPFSYSLTLNKRDTHNGYKLLVKRTESKTASEAQLAFDTPGSSVDRALSFDMSLNYKRKTLEIDVVSPWKTANAKGTLENNWSGFEGEVVIDKADKYSILGNMKKVNKNKGWVIYKPNFKLTRPGARDIRLQGSMDTQGIKQADIDLSLEGITRKPIVAKGAFKNTKTDKQVLGVLNLGDKKDYSFDMGLAQKFQKKSRLSKTIPTLTIKTPTTDLVRLSGSVASKPWKSLNSDVSLYIYKVLPNSLNVSCDWEIATGKKTRYSADVAVKSEYISGKMMSYVDVRKKRTTASKLLIDYKAPGIRFIKSNRFEVSSKIVDRSTKSTRKYLTNANFIAQKNPDLNFQVDLDLTHNKRNSKVDFELQYGKAKKDTSRKVKTVVDVDHTVDNKGANIRCDIEVTYPLKGVNLQVKGTHKHNKNSLNSNLKMVYGKGKAINAELNLKNSTRTNLKMSGDFSLTSPFKNINVKTNFDQKRKTYTQGMTLKWGKQKSTVTTTYEKGKGSLHTLRSDINFASLKPMTLSGKLDADLKDFQVSGELNRGKDTYGVGTAYSYSKEPKGKWSLDLYCPSRHVTAEVKGGKKGTVYSGSINTKWDADRDPGQKMQLEGRVNYKSLRNIDTSGTLKYPSRVIKANFNHQGGKQYTTHGDVSWSSKKQIAVDVIFSNDRSRQGHNFNGTVRLQTPFRNFQDMSAGVTSDNRSYKYRTTADLTWSRRDQISASMTLEKPYSLSKLNADVRMSTPFKGFKAMSGELSHSTKSNEISTSAKGTLEDKSADITLSAVNNGNENARDVKGNIIFKSNIPSYRTLSLNVAHRDDSKNFVTDVTCDVNSDRYKYDLDMTHAVRGWQYQNEGSLNLQAPGHRIRTTWSHLNSDQDTKTSFTSDWGRRQKIYFNLIGSHSMSPRMATTGTVTLQTPWEPVRDVEASLDNTFSRGLIRSKTHVKQNNLITASSDIKYIRSVGEAEFEIRVTNPFTNELKGKTNFVYRAYPFTGHAEFQWSPHQKISADGLLSMESIEQMEGELRVTSPYKSFRNILAKMSNKYEHGEWISTALLDYAPGKTIDLTSHLSPRKARINLKTPCQYLTKIDTGVEFSGGLKVFNSKADFTMEPLAGTYSGLLNWDLASLDINGKIRIDTPLEHYRYLQATISSQQTEAGKRHSRIEIGYHPREVIVLDASYQLAKPLLFDVSLSTPFQNVEHMSLHLKHALRRKGMQSTVELTYAPYKTIAGVVSLKWNKDIDGSFTLYTPFENFESTIVSFRHKGVLNDFTSHAEVSFVGKTGEADITFEHSDPSTEGTFTLKTPFQGWEVSKAAISRRGELTNLKSTFSVTYWGDQEIKIKVNNRRTPRRLDSFLLIKSPFSKDIKLSIDHDGVLRSFTTKLEGSVGITHSFSAQMHNDLRLPTIDFMTKLDVSCTKSKRNMGITLHKEGNLDNTNVDLTGEYNAQKVVIHGALDTQNAIISTLSIQTPFQNFNDVGLMFKHSSVPEQFSSEARLRYMDGKAIGGDLKFSKVGIRKIDTVLMVTTSIEGYKSTSAEYHHNLDDVSLSANSNVKYGDDQKIQADFTASVSPKLMLEVVVDTPFQNFEQNKIIMSHTGPLFNCKSNVEIVIAGTTINVQTVTENKMSDLKTEMTANTNLPGYEILKLTVNKEGILRNMKANAEVLVGKSSTFVSLDNRFSNNRLRTTFIFKNPYTEDFKLVLTNDEILPNTNSKLSLFMGQDASLDGEVLMSLSDLKFNFETKATYNLAGAGSSYGLKLGKNGPLDDLTGFITAFCKDKTIDVQASLNSRNKIHGEVTVTTPYQSFHNLGLVVDHTGRLTSFNSQAKLTFMDGQDIAVTVSHFNNRLTSIDSSFEIRTPFTGFEITRGNYKHSGNSKSFKCDVSLDYAAAQKLAGELSVSLSPKYEIEIKAETPFSGYKRVTASGSFGSQDKRYTVAGNVKIGRNKFNLNSIVDLKTSPISLVAEIKTPFENFENNDIAVTHRGMLTDFRSEVQMKSPLIGSVSWEASLLFTSWCQLDALLSASNGMKLSLMNKVQNDKHSSHAVAAWAPGQEIALDGSYMYTNWAGRHLIVESSLTAPFDSLKHVAFKTEYTGDSDKAVQNLEVELNHETLVDMECEYKMGIKHESTLTFRKPRPMQYTLSGQIGDKNIDTEVFVNWDRDEAESNVKLLTTLNDLSNGNRIDKNMKIKLIHPARTLGVVGNIMKSGSQTKSSGQLIWNENKGDMLSYDLDVTDKSRRYSKLYDGSLKLGTPLRDFQLDGSFSDARGRRSVDGTFFWDSNRDRTKQLGIKAALAPTDTNQKAEFGVRLPSIGKDIEVNTEMTLNDGRTLFGGKTEISYSSDTRKILTVSSKVEDISYGYDNKNYSMLLSISHPYTDIDVRFRSNIGKSSEKVTGNMDLMYLTTRRERKNFALRGEIDKIRKQLNLQVSSPLKTVEFSGEIEDTNPYRLKLRNTYDSTKMIKSEITVDTERRYVAFETNYDLDNPGNTLHMKASYVNSSAVQAELFRAFNYRRVTDSMMAVRLNTSRILHTRITWHPETIEELQRYLTRKVQSYGDRSKALFHTAYESLGTELSGKYQRIAGAVTEDLAEYVSLIETEMTSIERELDGLKRDLRRMYQRNDLFVATMGDTFMKAFDQYKRFVVATKAGFDELSSSMSDSLEQVKRYPIGQKYQQVVADLLIQLKNAIDLGVERTAVMIGRIDDQLMSLRDGYYNQVDSIKGGIKDSWNRINNHPRIVALKENLDYRKYANQIQEKVGYLQIPERVNYMVDSSRQMIKKNLASAWRTMTNNVYQEGVWAYNYWQVEDNLEKHLRSISEIIKDMIEEEFSIFSSYFTFLEDSRITVWDPQHGEIQLEMHLPIPLQSLDTLPEVDTSGIQKMTTAVAQYIPDKKTVNMYYNKYVPDMFWNQTKKNTEFNAQLNEYLSQEKRPRRMRKKYRVSAA